MNRYARQHGFALLLVLMLLVIACVALAAGARESTAAALRAQEMTSELQRRWAVHSCRATFEPRIEAILDESERGHTARDRGTTGPAHDQARRREPLAVLRVECDLAGHRYELAFTDEQAKVNLNTLLSAGTRADAQLIAKRLSTGKTSTPAQVLVRPLVFEPTAEPGAATGRTLAASLGAYGQVFESASPADLLGTERQPGLASMLTLWGDGRVSLRRAPDAVLEVACNKALGAVTTSALLEARRTDPYRTLTQTLALVDRLDARDRQRLPRLVTDSSNCHGLWVVARGPSRAWYTLSVIRTARTQAADGLPGVAVVDRVDFEW